MSVKARRWRWLLLRVRDPRMPYFDASGPIPIPPAADTYRIVKSGRSSRPDAYEAWQVVGTFVSLEEATAMKKLLD